jgi:hypothetical protein
VSEWNGGIYVIWVTKNIEGNHGPNSKHVRLEVQHDPKCFICVGTSKRKPWDGKQQHKSCA